MKAGDNSDDDGARGGSERAGARLRRARGAGGGNEEGELRHNLPALTPPAPEGRRRGRDLSLVNEGLSPAAVPLESASLLTSNFVACSAERARTESRWPALARSKRREHFPIKKFIQRNGRDGCGPSAFGVSQPRGKQACAPQLSPPTLFGFARRAEFRCVQVRALPSSSRCAMPKPARPTPTAKRTLRSGRGLGTRFAASGTRPRPRAPHRHARKFAAIVTLKNAAHRRPTRQN